MSPLISLLLTLMLWALAGAEGFIENNSTSNANLTESNFAPFDMTYAYNGYTYRVTSRKATMDSSWALGISAFHCGTSLMQNMSKLGKKPSDPVPGGRYQCPPTLTCDKDILFVRHGQSDQFMGTYLQLAAVLEGIYYRLGHFRRDLPILLFRIYLPGKLGKLVMTVSWGPMGTLENEVDTS